MHTTASARRDRLDLRPIRRDRIRNALSRWLGGAGGATLAMPVWFGLGAALALSAAEAPPWRALALAAGVATLLLLVLRRSRFSAACFAAAMVLAGGARGGHAVEAGAPPPEVRTLEGDVVLEGWIAAVERSPNGRPRLRLALDDQPGWFSVRLLADPGDFRAGDRVRLRARLSRFPGPAVPGGYDSSRRAWFQKTAFTGFALGPVAAAADPGVETPRRALVRLRGRLSERIREEAGEPAGGLIAALLTGDRSGVSAEQTEALRGSGLGHLLAISGLHMALFAGGVFFAARWLIASVYPLARGRDPAQPAAALALLAAAAYLALSGFSVSTQRAFVMSALVLGAVIARRRAISMRGLSIAAMIVLALSPESVTEPGFQMSFGAAGALVAVYGAWRRIRPPYRSDAPPGRIGKAGAWFTGLAVTSLVAGSATAGFGAMHFNRLAGWGLLANLAAMPVFTLWVMPTAALGLALSPTGLEAPLLQFSAAGMELVLAIAERAAGAPGAWITVPSPPVWAAALYTLGFAWLVLGGPVQRLCGVALLAAALAGWAIPRTPEAFVAENGVAVIRVQEGWASTRPGRPGFGAERFLQRAGARAANAADLVCDTESCAITSRSGLILAFPPNARALREDCRHADVVVARFAASPAQRRACRAYLLDDVERARRGGVELRVSEAGTLTRRASQDAARPWRSSDRSG